METQIVSELNTSTDPVELKQSSRRGKCGAIGIVIVSVALLYVGSFIPVLWLVDSKLQSTDDRMTELLSFIYAPVLRLADSKSLRSSINLAFEITGTSNSLQQLNDHRARNLLKSSRSQLAQNNFDDARALAERAEQIETGYYVFEDRSELLLADISRAEVFRKSRRQVGN